jgi:hypothetical protein
MIDVHAHFVTPEYAAAARAAGHTSPDGMPGWPDWDPDTHLRLMDEWDIAVAMLSVSSPGVHFGDDQAARALARTVNEYGTGIRWEHRDRFGHFASLPLPDVQGALAETAYALDELGSDGVIRYPRWSAPSAASGCSTAATTAGHPPRSRPYSWLRSMPPTSRMVTPGERSPPATHCGCCRA